MQLPAPQHIDAFMETCGYFEPNTHVNNGYGCRHPEADDFDYVGLTDLHYFPDEKKIKLAILRQDHGSFERIGAALSTNSAATREQLYRDLQNPERLARVGVAMMGKCMASGCPLACVMDEEDWAKHPDLGEFEEDWVIPLIV